MAYCIFGISSSAFEVISLSNYNYSLSPEHTNIFTASVVSIFLLCFRCEKPSRRLRLVRWCSSKEMFRGSGSADSVLFFPQNYRHPRDPLLIIMLTTKLGYLMFRQHEGKKTCFTHGISAKTAAWRGSDRTSPHSTSASSSLPIPSKVCCSTPT